MTTRTDINSSESKNQKFHDVKSTIHYQLVSIKLKFLTLSVKLVNAPVAHACFVSRRSDIMRKAFIACIRPILEYNGLVWNPCQVH
jgi:uncharacterized membrane protein